MIRTLRSPKGKNIGFILAMVGFVILVFWFLVREKLPDNFLVNFMSYVIAGTTFFLWGCVGLVSVIRQELLQVVVIRGKWAVIHGLILWIGCWLFSIWIVILFFSRLLF